MKWIDQDDLAFLRTQIFSKYYELFKAVAIVKPGLQKQKWNSRTVSARQQHKMQLQSSVTTSSKHTRQWDKCNLFKASATNYSTSKVYTTEKVLRYPQTKLLRFCSTKDQTHNPGKDRSNHPKDKKEHNDTCQDSKDRWAIWRTRAITTGAALFCAWRIPAWGK